MVAVDVFLHVFSTENIRRTVFILFRGRTSMADNEKNQEFNTQSPSAQRRFGGDVPQGSKKERPRGEFSTEMNVDPEASVVWGPERHVGTPEPVAPLPRRIVKRLPLDKKFEVMRLVVLLCAVLPLTVFAFLPALREIAYAWWYKIDYGHGLFVIPLVALALFLRLDNYPGTCYRLTWIGLFPILICCAMRAIAAQMYMNTVDQWSLFFWILGIVWFFYGNRAFFWALPSLSYLVFMFQLPWSYEVLMRQRLQAIAAHFAAIQLQLIGEPAIPIENTIRLSNQELAVEMACSGIRFLMSILAVAFATILIMRRSWWQNVLIVAIAPPIALFINAARIAMTGILLTRFESFMQSITPENRSVAVIADKIAGFTMIPIAIGIFFAFVWYLGKVFRRVEISG